MSIKLFNVAQTSGRASSVPPQTENLTSTIQMTTGDADKNTAWREDERPIENKGIRPKVYSQVSGDAPFETLFNKFDLIAPMLSTCSGEVIKLTFLSSMRPPIAGLKNFTLI